MSVRGFLVLLSLGIAPVHAQEALDRTVLPIPEPQHPPITEQDARKATPPPRFEVKAPAKAPNVVIVLIDDFGFGQSSTFGGPVRMPTLETLAKGGVRYNRFHTTALCSPTRMALLTGRNHHAVNTGAMYGDEGVDVGTDNETPVTEEYKEGDNRFTGRIRKVTVELK